MFSLKILLPLILKVVLSKCEFLNSDLNLDFYSEIDKISCQNDFCGTLDLIGPPPDMILDIPPPPIPSFLKNFNIQNESENKNQCNYCHLFDNQNLNDLGYGLPKQSSQKLNSWLPLIIISMIGSILFSIIFFVFIIKCKNLKLSTLDLCSTLSHSLFVRNKNQPPCSVPDACVTPVVNEKSVQSIITNSPCKKSTIIPAKYWKTPTGMNFHCSNQNNHIMHNTDLMDNSKMTEISEYIACQEAESCTSSPVYAELDSNINNQHINQENIGNIITMNSLNNLSPMNNTVIINNQPVCFKAYSMRTYSEIPDPAKLSQLNQNSVLLPDASYDNEAYLPSSNSDYHNKSLKKNRQSTLSKLGSKTPLLGSQCPINNNSNHSLTLGYLLNDKYYKKAKQTFIQHQIGSKFNINTLMVRDQDSETLKMQPRYVQGNGKNIIHEIYNGQQPAPNSPSLNTFRSSYAFNKDQPKRPLPPVPGVRL